MILSPFFKLSIKANNRRGIVLFVVIGAIVILGVLVASYNYLVMGKSNESREILKHLRAEKCAQSLCRFVFSHLISDLNDETSGGGRIIKDILFSSNSPDKLSEDLGKKWLAHIGCEEVVTELLKNTIGSEKPDAPLVELGFSDITPLNSLKSAKGIGDEVSFLDLEKVGRLTVRVTIKIGKSRAVWQETRPFKVVFPFPIPITKFNFYWTDGADDPYAFNTISIKSDTGDSANGKHPFLLDNISLDPTNKTNAKEDVWIDRGWIYIGGDSLILNRASGSKKYGQNFYSYFEPGPPVTLMLDFPSGDRWDTHRYNNELLGFRVAYWGFSDSLTGSSNQTWKMILKSEYENNPPDSSASAKYWNSSCLHLFSDKEILGNGSSANNIIPTITRVSGNVYDRFLEMGYLLPTSSSDSLFAATIGIKDDTEFNSLKSNYSSEENKYSFENFLFFSDGYDFESDSDKKGADVLEDYFQNLEYSVNNTSAVDYYKIMSKANFRSIDETYNVIAGYSKSNEDVSIPPLPFVPKTDDLTFQPQNTDKFTSKPLVFNEYMKNIGSLKISEIGKCEDKTLGLSLRTCYEITGSSDGIQSIMNTYFCSNSSDLNLNNLVYKVTPDSGKVRFSNMSIKTPGTIYSDGPMTVGSFLPSPEDTVKTPVMMLSGNGAITINNSGNNEVRAYLVALGEGGTVKADRKDVPLLISGGMAVKEFKPENIPDKGGYLVYNTELDPLREDFIQKYIGVVIGPKGCNP